VFEVKEGRVRGDSSGVDGLTVDVEGDSIKLNRQVGSALRGTRITGATQPDAELVVSASQLTWHAVVPAHGTWSTSVQITPSLNGRDLVELRPKTQRGGGRPAAGPEQRLADWRRQTLVRRQTPGSPRSSPRAPGPRVTCGSSIPNTRTARLSPPEPVVPTIFGRDSLITSWMVLPLDPRSRSARCAR
jgi:hypothetical protein